MNIHKYISEFPIIPGKEIGIGADGQVFELSNNLVIKYSIIFDYNNNIHNEFNYRSNLLKSINSEAFVKIYDFSKVIESARLFDNNKQTYIVYYYIMDKLNKISEDESKVFHTLLSHEDFNKEKTYSNEDLITICEELSNYLDFDLKQVIEFINLYKQSKYIHLDLHPRNIMKQNNKFKLIDLDRMKQK